jgi:hypothetical protein
MDEDTKYMFTEAVCKVSTLCRLFKDALMTDKPRTMDDLWTLVHTIFDMPYVPPFGESCCICMEPHSVDGTLVMECGHGFHNDCFCSWYSTCLVGETGLVCPTCRDGIEISPKVSLTSCSIDTHRICLSIDVNDFIFEFDIEIPSVDIYFKSAGNDFFSLRSTYATGCPVPSAESQSFLINHLIEEVDITDESLEFIEYWICDIDFTL